MADGLGWETTGHFSLDKPECHEGSVETHSNTTKHVLKDCQIGLCFFD